MKFYLVPLLAVIALQCVLAAPQYGMVMNPYNPYMNERYMNGPYMNNMNTGRGYGYGDNMYPRRGIMAVGYL
ncbi:hypothetical protein JYU34_014481 [Plutella xylostella]|uniref:Uncharacterized protein n=1 Tax=Plutella xylostella TaxID=51655 RepID=A0ABQ7Q9T4_PLUXY|nr:hypothetical protein JYU34_014481 [Plutella xylostella]